MILEAECIDLKEQPIPPSALIVDADPFARRGTGASRIFILLSHGGALLAWLSAKRLVPEPVGLLQFR
jgi:hypothetical protein